MELKRQDLIYRKACYKIIGILFDVYNELGAGYQEKFYQRAIALTFKKNKIIFKEQVYTPIKYKGNKIGNYYLDFLIADKIILEIKRGNYFSKTNIQQVFSYLKTNDLKLGLLVNFTTSGVKFKRIVNIK